MTCEKSEKWGRGTDAFIKSAIDASNSLETITQEWKNWVKDHFLHLSRLGLKCTVSATLPYSIPWSLRPFLLCTNVVKRLCKLQNNSLHIFYPLGRVLTIRINKILESPPSNSSVIRTIQLWVRTMKHLRISSVMGLRQLPEGLLKELSFLTDRDIQPCIIAPLDMDTDCFANQWHHFLLWLYKSKETYHCPGLDVILHLKNKHAVELLMWATSVFIKALVDHLDQLHKWVVSGGGFGFSLLAQLINTLQLSHSFNYGFAYWFKYLSTLIERSRGGMITMLIKQHASGHRASKTLRLWLLGASSRFKKSCYHGF